MKKILVLFPSAWDETTLTSSRYAGRYTFLYESGNRVWSHRSLGLLTFDVLRFIDEIVKRYGRQGIDGVFSTDDWIGAAVAAAVARRLCLSGPDPKTVIATQHKYHARRTQERLLPDATPRFALCSPDPHDGEPGLAYPFFLKPVKGTYSVFAGPVGSPSELRQRLRFGLAERFVLKRLLKPFDDLLRFYGDGECDARRFLAEELVEGVQVTVDGYVHGGRVEILGIVDALMHPGTHTFLRFDYPSQLDPGVRVRMAQIGRRLVEGIGFDHGCFNIEMLHEPATGGIKIVEINLRLSPQFADLYEKVDACNLYDVQLDLCVGREPVWDRSAGGFRHAASFPLRTFAGRRIRSAPDPVAVHELRQRFPGSRILLCGRSGQSLKWEMRALGSFRYAVVNFGGDSREALLESYRAALERIAFRFE